MPPREIERAEHETLLLIPLCSQFIIRRRHGSSTKLSRMSPDNSPTRQRLHDGNSNNNNTNNRLPQKPMASDSWTRRVWELHFAISLCVLLLGILSNHQSRKYIPIPTSVLVNGSCEHAFLNTFADSADSPRAIVSCTRDAMRGLCRKTKLPLARRLSKFPEAWLVPLIPWFLRWFMLVGSKQGRAESIYMWRRLALYIGLMFLRGLVLYQGMNQVEGYWLRSHPEEDCWYESYLRPGQPSCYGRLFDFSDHVVLYFAQILPIGLFETLDVVNSYINNYRVASATATTRAILDRNLSISGSDIEGDFDDDDASLLSARSNTSLTCVRQRHPPPMTPSRLRWTDSFMLVVILAVNFYIYVITMWSVHRTAAYFHTAVEIMAGYLVSLAVQIPLYYYRGGTNSNRSWLFGGNDGGD